MLVCLCYSVGERILGLVLIFFTRGAGWVGFGFSSAFSLIFLMVDCDPDPMQCAKVSIRRCYFSKPNPNSCKVQFSGSYVVRLVKSCPILGTSTVPRPRGSRACPRLLGRKLQVFLREKNSTCAELFWEGRRVIFTGLACWVWWGRAWRSL